MSIRTLLLITALIGAPAVYANETNPHLHAITQNLKTLIDHPDSTGFKATFAKNITEQKQQWLITQENATDCTNTLLTHAQAKRNALQQKYAGLSHYAKEYKTLAKGAGQYYLGLCLKLGTILAMVTLAKVITNSRLPGISPNCKPFFEFTDSLHEKIKNSYIAAPSLLVAMPIKRYENLDLTGSELMATLAYGIPSVLAVIGGTVFTHLGAQNIKQGFNYKTHLENEIKNLDDIINHLQSDNLAITTNSGEQI